MNGLTVKVSYRAVNKKKTIKNASFSKNLPLIISRKMRLKKYINALYYITDRPTVKKCIE